MALLEREMAWFGGNDLVNQPIPTAAQAPLFFQSLCQSAAPAWRSCACLQPATEMPVIFRTIQLTQSK